MNLQTAVFLIHLKDVICEQKGIEIGEIEYQEMVRSANIRAEAERMGIRVYEVPRPQEVQ